MNMERTAKKLYFQRKRLRKAWKILLQCEKIGLFGGRVSNRNICTAGLCKHPASRWCVLYVYILACGNCYHFNIFICDVTTQVPSFPLKVRSLSSSMITKNWVQQSLNICWGSFLGSCGWQKSVNAEHPYIKCSLDCL
jgi:hypothetical protein